MKKNHVTLLCVCTVVLIILGSSTTVLGYQTVQRPEEPNKRLHQSEDLLSLRVPFDLKNEDRLRHPFLFLMVWLYLQWYLFRGWILYEFSISIGAFHWIQIDYPLVFLRACFLILVGEFWFRFWHQLSSALGWHWSLDSSP